MAKIRILRVQSRICVGGPSLNAIYLSAGLPATEYRTLLVGGKLEPGEMSMASKAIEEGVALHELPEMGRSIQWFDDLKALWKLMRLIRHFKPHIVHTHTAKAGALGRIAAFLCRVPLRVHTFHGHVFHGYFSPSKSHLFVWLERCLAWISHRVVVISPRQFEEIVEDYKVVAAKKTRIVRLGFHLEHMVHGEPGRFRSSLGLPPETFLAGIVARLVPIKNHVLLLEGIAVWANLQQGFSARDIQFLIIGDGELRGELEKKVQALGIESWVRFVGWRRDLADIYADLNLNILVSKNEGTPVTLIEGLACGVPILATDVGGIKDFADERCGSILPATADANALGAALLHHFDPVNRIDRLDAELQQEIFEKFHVNRLVSDMDQLYREALSSKVLAATKAETELPEILTNRVV